MFAWDDLRYFLAFARTGSFLAAAKTLGVNQSTVQRRIAELEGSLGKQLVVRHLSVGYRLTELGEALRPSIDHVEQAVTALMRDVAARDTGLTGTIRVTTLAHFAARLSETQLIDLFHARYPGLRVELMISDRVFDLSKGEADVAIRAGHPQDEALIGRKLGDAPWALYAGRSYVERYGTPKCAVDIEQHLIVTCVPCVADDPVSKWVRSVAPHARIAAQCDSSSDLVQSVKSGAGLAPMMVYQEDSELVRVFDISDLATPFYLLMHRDMQQSPRVRAFADFIASEVKAFRVLVGEHS
jgi:DNA-binding transcriptional LysR family regulator